MRGLPPVALRRAGNTISMHSGSQVLRRPRLGRGGRGGLEIHDLPTNHFDIMKKPWVNDLALELAHLIRNAVDRGP